MKAILVVIVFLLLGIVPVKAQDFDELLSKGQVAYDSGQYELAIKYLEPYVK